jgi:hypothetical protein
VGRGGKSPHASTNSEFACEVPLDELKCSWLSIVWSVVYCRFLVCRVTSEGCSL